MSKVVRLALIGVVLGVSLTTAQDPSGKNMPNENFGPWQIVFQENFNTDAALGEFMAKYGGKFDAYGKTWDPDTRNPQNAPWVDTWRRGVYSPARTLSVKGGLLDIWPHVADGPQFGSDGAFVPRQQDCKGTKKPCALDRWADLARLPWQPGRPYVAAITPLLQGSRSGDQMNGRYSVRFRVEDPAGAAGFKTAWLLWPRDGGENWPQFGEIDYPEGDLANNSYDAFHHHTCRDKAECEALRAANKYQDKFGNIASYANWHTVTIEWAPGKISFLLDGEVARTREATPRLAQTTTRVPSTPMHWVLQTETELNYNPIAPTAQAHILVDWMVVWKYNASLAT